MKYAISGQFDYYDQKKVLYVNMEYMDLLPPTAPNCPQPRFRARDLHALLIHPPPGALAKLTRDTLVKVASW